MLSSSKILALVVMSTLIFACNPIQNPENTMSEKSILAANDKLYEALNSMFEGKFEPLDKIWSHSDQVTYMGPFGGKLVGWQAVGADFKEVTEMKLGGHISAEDISIMSGTDMAYVACTEVGVNLDPSGNSVEVRHRATNVFQLEDGEWRLVHHHTDIAEQLETAYDKVIE